MRVYQKADGGTLQSARDYDIAYNTAIEKGQVVTLSEGLVTPAAQKVTGRVLGIAAENHSGVADVLDGRSNGVKIHVHDTPDAVWQCPAPKVTAQDGTSTTLPVAALKAFANDDFNGGYVKLVSKASGSTNTDEIGQVRRITDFALDAAAASATKGTLTLTSGGAPYAGDVYLLFPPIGFAKGQLDSARQALDLSDSASLSLKVVGRDEDAGTVMMMAAQHVLGVEE